MCVCAVLDNVVDLVAQCVFVSLVDNFYCLSNAFSRTLSIDCSFSLSLSLSLVLSLFEEIVVVVVVVVLGRRLCLSQPHLVCNVACVYIVLQD